MTVSGNCASTDLILVESPTASIYGDGLHNIPKPPVCSYSEALANPTIGSKLTKYSPSPDVSYLWRALSAIPYR